MLFWLRRLKVVLIFDNIFRLIITMGLVCFRAKDERKDFITSGKPDYDPDEDENFTPKMDLNMVP